MKKRSKTITFKRVIKDLAFILTGIFSASFALKSFLLPSKFIDGGATGIALLTSELTYIPLWVLLFCINVPFIYLASKVVGKSFAFKTSCAITGLTLCVALVSFPDVTHDKLLVAVFGGFFLGAGIGLSVRGGAVIDGTEVLAIYLSRKIGTTIGDIILCLNIVIFSVAAYLLSIEIALYSMITYLSAAKTIDFVIEGIEEYIGVTIISTQSEDIRQTIIDKLGRGVTIYRGNGGYGKRGQSNEIDIIYTVITRLELNKLNAEIESHDPEAFVVMNTVKETRGGIIKKRPLQH